MLMVFFAGIFVYALLFCLIFCISLKNRKIPVKSSLVICDLIDICRSLFLDAVLVQVLEMAVYFYRRV